MSPDGSDLESLSNKSSNLAAALDRNWLLQIITAGVALLYLTDQAKAGKLAENFNVDPDLVGIAIPLVFTYLFIRMGYLLGMYLETRARLITRLPRDEERRELLILIHNDVSVFALLSGLVNRAGLRPPTGSYLAKIVYGFPFVLIVVFVGAIFAVNTGLGLYFVYDLLQEQAPDLKEVVPAVVVVALLFFYWQFVFSRGLKFKGQLTWPVKAIAVLVLIASLTLAGAEIIRDPIEPDKVPADTSGLADADD